MPIILTEEKEKEKEKGKEERRGRGGLGRPVHACTEMHKYTHSW